MRNMDTRQCHVIEQSPAATAGTDTYALLFELWQRSSPGRRAATVAKYRKVLDAFATFIGGMPLADVRRRNLLAFRDHLLADRQLASRQADRRVFQARSAEMRERWNGERGVDEKTGAEAPVLLSNLSRGQIRRCGERRRRTGRNSRRQLSSQACDRKQQGRRLRRCRCRCD